MGLLPLLATAACCHRCSLLLLLKQKLLTAA
jgi:hypothetical protein